MNRRTGTGLAALVVAGVVVLALVAGAAQARGGRGCEPSPDRAVARLTERLSLRADQQAQVRQILEAEFTKRREAREARRAEREAQRQRTEAELARVLSADQMAALRRLRDDRGDARGDCGGGRGGRGRSGGGRGCGCDCGGK